ncbi:hypothetical protein [Tunicatimonas pelagia]|uniref:hypothetical protein n=1 Tax=Tunicatimonas pelagia TaxID=931531 RepID=UPI002665BDE4|nr:hypothetical protein [Tunicatimonas pelagia]WKN44859.1 hypothetical protein P0M28_07775 [Tunicatimonas pelagia]
MMRYKHLVLLLLVSVSQPADAQNYLQYVQTFADTLLSVGLDTYGPHHTPFWAGVIDTRDRSVPIRSVPPTPGVRPSDRAVGGSNYYHDVLTLQVFDQLSKLTADPRYRQAAHDYSQAFLKRTQHPETGLLGWGEHLYYNFYTDTVSVAEELFIDQRNYFKMPHELIAWTPPWERLWSIDSARTQRAIEGLKYHFNGPDVQTHLFNRHAIWNKVTYQQEVMPWIKHAALYAYSFAFLHRQTGDEGWKEKSWQIGTLYWNLRDHRTDLVFGTLYHKSPKGGGKDAELSNTALYAYWLYKAGEMSGFEAMKQQAMTLLSAYDRYGWNEAEQKYYSALNLDGTPPENTRWATPWKQGYGSSSLLSLGRVAAYIAQRESSDTVYRMAEKALMIANRQSLPDTYSAQNLGEAIGANLDLYELTNDRQYLDHARRYADAAVEQLWSNGLFVRQNNDLYYEAKLGVGDLLSGLLRLHLALNNQLSEATADWSF